MRTKAKKDTPNILILKRRLISGAASVLLIFSALSFSVYAWFFFPMTQYTRVYTDGVKSASVKSWVYDKSTASFLPIISEDGILKLEYRFEDNAAEVVNPYFFLWGGEYTTNDRGKTIYKDEITYENKMGANPTKMRLYGDVDFTSYCVGRYENIDIDFMRLSYFIPDGENNGQYLNEENYETLAGDQTETSLSLIDTRDGSGLSGFDYKVTVYFMIQTDAAALEEDAALISEEQGLLDAFFKARVSFYYRTEPVNDMP
jgi:hypothetical protein